MKELTLIIPAKFESESLPVFLNDIKNLNVKKKIILDKDDEVTINSISSATTSFPNFLIGRTRTISPGSVFGT